MRVLKFLLAIISTILLIVSYNCKAEFWDNGSNSFDASMAFFCFSLTLIALVDNWQDNFARLIFGTIFLMTFNNLLDEVLFNPFVFDSNEIFFGACIGTNFIINIYLIYCEWKTN